MPRNDPALYMGRCRAVRDLLALYHAIREPTTAPADLRHYHGLPALLSVAASEEALNPNVMPMCSQCDSAGRLEGARTLRCAVIVNVAWRGPGSYDAVRRHAFRSGGSSVTFSSGIAAGATTFWLAGSVAGASVGNRAVMT